MTKQICFASNNKHKLSEIRLLLEPDFFVLSLDDIGCKEELPETQDTFEGNAFQKALYVFNNYKVPCFADDSGLAVDALGGAPGVFSARYAGPKRNDIDNIKLLLQNLNNSSNRRAVFITVIALVGVGSNQVFEGRIRGEIAERPTGGKGFGYDPVFMPLGFSKTFAEMTMQEKNEISHRSIAIKKLVHFLKTQQG